MRAAYEAWFKERHTTVKTTERYAHLQIERQAEAMARLGALHDEEMKKSAKSS